MITRLWRGWTAAEDADAYQRFFAFAGSDPEVPVLEPQALALLSRYDARAQHFDTTSFAV
jgi:hypothetical protein